VFFSVSPRERIVRHPHEIERLYLDFDGFFASVEQQVHPHVRGKPVGVGEHVNCGAGQDRLALRQQINEAGPVRERCAAGECKRLRAGIDER